MRTRTLVVMALLAGSAAGPSGVVDAAAGSAVAPAALPTLQADFDGDGRQDLAVGAPLETVGSVRDAGAVFVLYGSDDGLTGTGSQLFNQASAGIASDPEEFDQFGSALVAGDFDADGFTDLAIAAEQESVGSVPSAGVVHVLRGSAAGLRAKGSLLLTQDTAGVGSTVEPSDVFGSALAAGDFNADQVDDLAIGARGEQVGPVEQAGAAFVLYGARARGLSGTGSTLLTQGGAAVPSEPEPTDLFGSALGAADFDGNGADDLAVGARGESAGNDAFAGAVNVFAGTPAGVTTRGSRIFTEDVAGLAAAAEPFDGFGTALATGDLDADGYGDLAVGAPGEGIGGAGGEGAGTVFLLPGSRSGLRGPGSRRFDQNTPGVPDDVEAFDAFGTALAVGDLDGNETDDVAIGVPSESVGDVDFAGVVCVLYSADFGAPSGIESQLVTQDTPGLGETAEVADRMGLALAAGDFDADGIADLAIGAPFESLGDVFNAGTFHVLPGTADGVTGTGSQTFTQDSPGIGSTAEPRDVLGFTLAATTSGPSGSAPG